jgi:hypothetical protein
MKSQTLSPEELQILQDYQSQNNQNVLMLGNIELQLNILTRQKTELLKEFQTLLEEQQATGKKLQDKYGEGNINLEDGSFVPIE